jgi:hypothetical protein
MSPRSPRAPRTINWIPRACESLLIRPGSTLATLRRTSGRCASLGSPPPAQDSKARGLLCAGVGEVRGGHRGRQDVPGRGPVQAQALSVERPNVLASRSRLAARGSRAQPGRPAAGTLISCCSPRASPISRSAIPNHFFPQIYLDRTLIALYSIHLRAEGGSRHEYYSITTGEEKYEQSHPC